MLGKRLKLGPAELVLPFNVPGVLNFEKLGSLAIQFYCISPPLCQQLHGNVVTFIGSSQWCPDLRI